MACSIRSARSSLKNAFNLAQKAWLEGGQQQQLRFMGSHGKDLHRHFAYDGKIPPHGPEYVTHGGLTLHKDWYLRASHPAQHWGNYLLGTFFWFWMLYRFYHDGEKLLYGEIYILERDLAAGMGEEDDDEHDNTHGGEAAHH